VWVRNFKSCILLSRRPAAAALGDSLKAEHQRLQPGDGDGVRALKLLLAGCSSICYHFSY
jgi:hypothetical protein